MEGIKVRLSKVQKTYNNFFPSCLKTLEIGNQEIGNQEITYSNSFKQKVVANLGEKLLNQVHALLKKALVNGDFAKANLANFNLTKANLTGANLTNANLTGADLTGANLTNANLIDANLTGANLTDANLTGANLAGAKISLRQVVLPLSLSANNPPENAKEKKPIKTAATILEKRGAIGINAIKWVLD